MEAWHYSIVVRWQLGTRKQQHMENISCKVQRLKAGFGGGKCKHRGDRDGAAKEALDKAVRRARAAGEVQT